MFQSAGDAGSIPEVGYIDRIKELGEWCGEDEESALRMWSAHRGSKQKLRTLKNNMINSMRNSKKSSGATRGGKPVQRCRLRFLR